MKYDDAEYLFLNFETERSNEDAGTHIGMYLAWAVLRGLGSEALSLQDVGEPMQRLLTREITGADVLWEACDGKLTDEDFNAVGNAFTSAYYEKHFEGDYRRVFERDFVATGHPTDDYCSVPNTWANFERMAAVLDQRLAQWKRLSAQPPAQAPSQAPSRADAPAAPTSLALEPKEEPKVAPAQPSLDELQRRAKQGDREAWFDLGAEYLTGERTKQDHALAAMAFEQAAKLGQVDAQFNLGVCYQNGAGTPKSPSQALYWFSQAADGGHPEGMYMLGMAYRTGKGVEQDYGASNALLLLARSKGSANAASAGIMAGSGGYAELFKEISQPGKLLSTLAARRSQASPGGGQAAPSSSNRARSASSPAGAASRSTRGDRSGHSTQEKQGDAFAVAATLIGAAAFFVLLMISTKVTGAPLKFTMLVLGGFGAVGTWQLSAAMGHGVVLRLVLTLCALVPLLGSFTCMLMLKWRWKR